MTYEKPRVYEMGDASELILGGGKYGKDCCGCFKYTSDDELGEE